MRPSASKVKYAAFLPNKDGKTSVYRTTGSSEEEVWKIGRDYVLSLMAGSEKGQKKLRGRGEIVAESVFEQNLTVEPDPAPHPLHANIANWPEEKESRVAVAKELAQTSDLVLNPGP